MDLILHKALNHTLYRPALARPVYVGVYPMRVIRSTARCGRHGTSCDRQRATTPNSRRTDSLRRTGRRSSGRAGTTAWRCGHGRACTTAGAPPGDWWKNSRGERRNDSGHRGRFRPAQRSTYNGQSLNDSAGNIVHRRASTRTCSPFSSFKPEEQRK